jgi:hypothetical protein
VARGQHTSGGQFTIDLSARIALGVRYRPDSRMGHPRSTGTSRPCQPRGSRRTTRPRPGTTCSISTQSPAAIRVKRRRSAAERCEVTSSPLGSSTVSKHHGHGVRSTTVPTITRNGLPALGGMGTFWLVRWQCEQHHGASGHESIAVRLPAPPTSLLQPQLDADQEQRDEENSTDTGVQEQAEHERHRPEDHRDAGKSLRGATTLAVAVFIFSHPVSMGRPDRRGCRDHVR